jgi:hypothetical protein
MVSKRLSIFGLISAAAVVSGVLTGCGGSSATTANTTTSVPQTGTIQATTGAPTQSLGTSATSQTVPATVNGQQVQVTVPPGQPAISTSSTLAVIPAGTAILGGLSAQFNTPATGVSKPQTTAGGGEVYIGYSRSGPWLDTGVNIGANGAIPVPLAFVAPTTSTPSGNWLRISGPIQIVGNASNSGTLNITGSLTLGFNVFNSGLTTIPTTLSVKLPANGASCANGDYADVVLGPTFSGYGTLDIWWPNNGSLTQTSYINAGAVDFAVHGKGSAKDIIPSTGITGVDFELTGLNF